MTALFYIYAAAAVLAAAAVPLAVVEYFYI